MQAKFHITSKTLVLLISLVMVNLTLLPGYEHAIATTLTTQDLLPEQNFYWVYERSDFTDNSIWKYNISVTGESTIRVANLDVEVLVVEGTGEIIQMPTGIVQVTSSEIYIKKLIRKDNLELVKYTQTLNLEYTSDGYLIQNYHNINITYDYVQFTKPDNITLGSNWTKMVKRTKDQQYKRGTDELVSDPPHTDLINSTLIFDNIAPVTIKSKTYNSYLVIEKQYNNEIIDKTIEYYYAKEAKGYVRKIRKNVLNQTEEIEQLIKFGIKKDKPQNNDPDNGETNGDDGAFLDPSDRNVQIILGVSLIIIAVAIVGYISYRRRQ